MNERRSNRRIRLLLGVFVLVFAGTLARAVWLQGVQASTLQQIASRQHTATTEIPAGRGTIYDRTGEPLAIGEQATTVYADPRSVKQPRQVALAAAKAFGLNAEKLYPLLADQSRHFVYVKRKADPAKAAELEKLKLPGLGFYAEELRYYPQRSVASHVLGYAGLDNKGLEGLERSLDKSLIGKPGTQTTVTDPAGHVIDVTSTKPERAGDDVFLTIDHRIQANAEACPPRDGQAVGGEGRHRDRARPAQRRRPRDGRRARLRRERVRLRLGRPPPQPCRHGRLRAGIDVQGRHRRRSALGEDRLTVDGVHARLVDPRRRPDHPRARAASDAADDGRSDRLAVLEHRHDHTGADARPVAPPELDQPVRIRQVDRSRRAG